VSPTPPLRRALHAHLAAGALLAGFVLAFFWRTLSGDVFQPADGGDLVSFLFPTYRFAARTLAAGQLPLWNPHLYGGAPFVADIQAGFLYLPNLALFLGNPDFPYTALQGMVLAHLWWAGLGLYALARALGRSWAAAVLAGLAFQFSDALLIHLGNLNLVAVLSWMGWVLAAHHRALEGRHLGWAGLAGLLFALGNYAGHPQSSYYVALALLLHTLLWWAGPGRERANGAPSRGYRSLLARRGPLGVLATTAGVSALLTGPILLPAWELLPYTPRADLPYQATVSYSLAPIPALVGLLTPGFFGRGPALHWSLWDRVELPYLGVPTLLLALAALLLARERRPLLPWAGLALFGLLVALGIYTPVHGWLTQLLPGYGGFRAPARAIVLWALGLSILAAYGLDSLQARPERPTTHPAQLRFQALLRTGGLALLLFITPLMFATLLVTQSDPTAFLRASLAALAVAWATLAWLATWLAIHLATRGALRPGWLGALLVAILFLELATTGAYTDISETDPTRGFQHPEILAFLRERGPWVEGPAGPQPLFRIDTRTEIQDLWQPDTAALTGLHDVGGVANPLILRHWEALWQATGGRHTRIYDMLNVDYVIVRDGTPLPPGFTLAFDAPGPLAVYRHSDPLPRAWLVTRARTVPDPAAALAALQDTDFNPAQEVILLDGQVPPDFTAAGDGPLGSVRITAYGPNELRLEVESSGPAYLVLSEVWYPGWRATVNGTEAPVLRANYGLRSVPVPDGKATVRLWFAADRFRLGGLAGLLGLVLLLAVTRIWRKIVPGR